MERSIANKKLRRLLGKSLAYRIDPNAPTREGRDGAKAELRAATAKHGSVNKQLLARRSAILGADAEYQRLTADYAETRNRVAKLNSITASYKIKVGLSDGFFFTVRAEGDSWEQVIEQLTTKQAS